MSRWVTLSMIEIMTDGLLQGNLTNLIEMTNWKGNDVLYIGDHIYGDLAVRVCDKRVSHTTAFSARICFLNMDGEQERSSKKSKWVLVEIETRWSQIFRYRMKSIQSTPTSFNELIDG